MPIDRSDELLKAILRVKLFYTDDQLKKLNPADLSDQQVFSEIYLSALSPFYWSHPLDANDFAGVLERLIRDYPDLEQTDRNLYLKYRSLVVYLRACSLFSQTPQIVENIFQKHLAFVMKMNLDVKEKVEDLLEFWAPSPDQLPLYRQAIIRGIRENSEKVGANKIKLRSGRETEPTIANWIIDYDSFSDKTAKAHTITDQVKYINQSANYNSLSDTEKTIILDAIRVFDLVVYLIGGRWDVVAGPTKLPTKEEVAEKKVTMQAPTRPATASQVGVAEKTVDYSDKFHAIKQSYSGDPAEEKAIADWQKQLLGQNAIQSLFEAVNNQNKIKTVAILRLLAKERGLEKIMAMPSSLNAMFQGFLQGQYGKEFLDRFSQNSQNPIYLQLFLQYILKEKLGLSDTESARQAIHLANIYAQAGNNLYLKMAYADEQTGVFKWAEVGKI